MFHSHRWIEFIAPFVALLLTIFFLRHGLSASDDGYYLWTAQRLLAGDILHLDIRSSHPGYASYLNAALLRAFGDGYLVLRYPLPLLSALLVYAPVRLARPAGSMPQAIVALAAIGLGLIQFITPSASWYANACAATAFVTFYLAGTRASPARLRWLFVTGLLLGVAAGFRQTNGALVGAGLVFTHALTAQPIRMTLPRWHHAASLLALVLAIMLTMAPAIGAASPSAWLLSSPIAVCGGLALFRWSREPATRSVDWLWPTLSGTFCGFLPVLALPTLHGALPEFVADTVFKAASYVSYAEASGNDFQILLGDAMELFAAAKPYAFANSVFLIMVVLLPMIFAGSLAAKYNRLTSPHIAALAVLGSILLLNQITYQGLLYTYFWLPTVLSAQLLLLSGNRMPKLLTGGIVLVSLFATCFHAGRLPGAVLGRMLADPNYHQVQCTLPHCNLWVDRGSLATWQREYNDLVTHVPSDKPLLVLPRGVTLYGVLPHRNAWSIGWVLGGLTTSAEIQHLSREVHRTPNTVVAIQLDYDIESEPIPGLKQFVSSLCLKKMTPHHRLYTACDGKDDQKPAP